MVHTYTARACPSSQTDMPDRKYMCIFRSADLSHISSCPHFFLDKRAQCAPPRTNGESLETNREGGEKPSRKQKNGNTVATGDKTVYRHKMKIKRSRRQINRDIKRKRKEKKRSPYSKYTQMNGSGAHAPTRADQA